VATAATGTARAAPPQIAPFTVPDPNRPLPPPASLAGADLPDLPDESKLEEGLMKLQSEAVITTASKRAQKVRDVPLTVSWIPADELEGTGQFTLCDAIQYFPGMECRRGAMRKAAVSSRGLGSNFLSNRLLLLKDGRPDTDPWTGEFYPDETTPLTNLKQIEVIRGPGSSLYGTNAFSGVINMVQRSAKDIVKEGNVFGADARLLAGAYDTVRLQSTAAASYKDLEAWVNYYGMRSNGPELFSDASRGIVDKNEWTQVNQISGRLGYKFASVEVEYSDSALGRPGGQAISNVGNCGRCHYTPNDSEHVQNFKASAQIDAAITPWLRVFGQGYAFFKRRETDTEQLLSSDLRPVLGKRSRLGGELRAVASFSKVTATVGGDVKGDTVNDRNVLPAFQGRVLNQLIFGAFADLEVRPFESLVLGAGARFDAHQLPTDVWTQPSAQISPRASLVYHLGSSVSLRANYGRAFRAPTLAELAINQEMYASTLLGNPGLKAETMDTGEGGVDVWLREGTVRLTGTGFFTYARDLINEQFVLGSTSRFQNVGAARVAGAEVEVGAQIKEINSSFDLAYQYLDARSVATGLLLDYAPNHRVYARGRTNIKGVAFAELYFLFVGPRYDSSYSVDANGVSSKVSLPPYLVATARVGARLFEGLNVSVMVQNLFDTHYEEMYGFPMPRIGAFAEIKYVY
jgi:outer membrane receptor protein involved in Fe transport